MSLRNEQQGFATRAIHVGYDPLECHGALNPPVFLNSTYAFDSTDKGSDRFTGEAQGRIYSRVGNPTASVLETRLAALEEGDAGLATSSGMGALTAVIWPLVKPGDEIVADKTLYGCTFSLLHHRMARLGVIARFCRHDRRSECGGRHWSEHPADRDGDTGQSKHARRRYCGGGRDQPEEWEFGGMIAMELKGGFAAGKAFMDATKLVTRAVSLGDAESLVQHPASMTHSTYSAEERSSHGFTDGLVRLPVGLEDYDDIRGDVFSALEQAYR